MKGLQELRQAMADLRELNAQGLSLLRLHASEIPIALGLKLALAGGQLENILRLFEACDLRMGYELAEKDIEGRATFMLTFTGEAHAFRQAMTLSQILYRMWQVAR